MNAVTMLLQDESVVRLGRTLLHFAWQGAAAAVLAGLLLLALRRASAAARYVAMLVVFAAMAVCPVVTFFALSPDAPPLSSSSIAFAPVEPIVSAPPLAEAAEPRPGPTAVPTKTRAPETAVWTSLRDRLEANLGWLAAAWALGVLALSLRLALGWFRLHRTRRAAREVLEGRWPQTLASLCEKLRVSRPVRLLQSAAQQTPLVMGWLRPVILLPASALSGLTAEQVEAVLAHELAHIRRHDYLINLLQTVVETLLFYHPAVWWLSSRLRWEREHCCDDLAVEVCGDAVGYARALAELEELRAAPEPALGLAGPLLSRIRRLLTPPARRVDLRASWLAAALVVALLLGLGVASQVSRGDEATVDLGSALADLTDSFERDRWEAQQGSSTVRVQPSFQAALERHRESIEALLAPARTSPAYATELADKLLSPLHEYAERFAPESTIGEELLGETTFAMGEYPGYGFGFHTYLLLQLVKQQRSAALAREAFAALDEVVRASSYLAVQRQLCRHKGDTGFDVTAELARERERYGGENPSFLGHEIAMNCEAYLVDLYLSEQRPYLSSAAMKRVEAYWQWRKETMAADGTPDWLEDPHMFTTINCIRDLAALQTNLPADPVLPSVTEAPGPSAEEDTAALADDEAPAAEAERAEEFLLFIPPRIIKEGDDVGSEARQPDDYVIIPVSSRRFSTGPDGVLRVPPGFISDIQKHGLLVLTPDQRYRVSEEDLPLLLQSRKEKAVDDESRPKTVQIDARGLDVGHVLQAVSRSTGAVIVLQQGVEGPITLKADLPADPEVLLDAVCEAKGWYWWRDETGAYIVSAKPMPGTAKIVAAAKVADDAEDIVYAIIELEHMPAGYVGSLFYPNFKVQAGRPVVPPTTPYLADMLPEGIRFVSATDYNSKRLLVAGTPQAIAQLRALVGIVDKKPPDVRVQVKAWPGSPGPQADVDLYDLDERGSGEYELKIGNVSAPSADAMARAFRDVKAHEAEVTLSNLASEIVPLPKLGVLPPLLLQVTPRVNGDRTVTVTLALVPMDDPDAPNSAVVPQDADLLTTVNVRSGESFVVVLAKGKARATILIEPTVLGALGPA